jgi:hypothetical protein
VSEPTKLFWYSSVIVQALFCAHLLWTGLAKKHPVFTLYLGCAVARSVAAFFFTLGYNGALPISYTYFWLWSEPILIILQIAVTLEVHSGIWKDNTGVGKPVRTFLFFLLLMAILFAAIPLKAELGRFGTVRLQMVLQSEFLAKRYISTVLALFLLFSAVLFLFAIRHSLRGELLRHESMLAAYFGIYAIAYFTVNMGWTRTTLVNNFMLSAVTLLLVIWISVLRPGPELAPQITRIQ